MQPLSLSVQAESPEIRPRKKIPSSQGLLATADTCSAVHNPPVSVPAGIRAQNDSSPQVLGLKLLKLHPSMICHDDAPHGTANPGTIGSHRPKDKHKDQATWKKRSGEQRSVFSAPVKRLSNNPPLNPAPRNPQPQMWPSERSVSQVAAPHPAFPTLTPTSIPGLRLLHVQHIPQSNITSAKLPLPFVSRPAVFSVPVTGAPVIKLLSIDSGPKMVSSPLAALRVLDLVKSNLVKVIVCTNVSTSQMLPRAAPPAQTLRLTSVQELSRSEIRRRDAEDAQLQLLRADLSTKDFRRPASPSSCTPSKRQYRIVLCCCPSLLVTENCTDCFHAVI